MFTPSGELQSTAETRVSTALFLADNNAADLHDVAQALTAAGHVVIKLTNGQQLLGLLDRIVPDAILLASGLPYHGTGRSRGKTPTLTLSNHRETDGGEINGDNDQSPHPLHTYDGFALCRLLAATTEWLDIPTILLTPIADPELRIRGIEMKSWDVMAKPCHLPELSVRINSLIKRAHFQRERSEELQRMQATLRQQTSDLQQSHAQQRQSEQKAELLLATTQAHSRQLYLLLTFALQQIGGTQLFPRQRQQQLQQQLQQQMSAIQTFLNQLSTLVAALSAYQQEMQPHPPQSHELSLPQPPFDSGFESPSQGPTPWQTADEPQIPPRRAAKDRGGSEETPQLPFLPTVGKQRVPQLNQLSDREYEILVRLANGEGYEEIAHLLEISTSTVRSYRSRIMHKLGITTATEMIKFAIRHRITDLS